MVIIYMLVNYPPTGYPPAGYPGPSASHYPASNSIKGLATLIIKQWCSFNRAFTSYEIYGDYPRYLALERRFSQLRASIFFRLWAFK
ncbi:hypothetical protein HanIR_Chr05g0224551 [Helianthus annuus]|nr:hypothetical protein HanIR_Chr05g0224551 [Helianthus annuus]